jgi:hypothetical protein
VIYPVAKRAVLNRLFPRYKKRRNREWFGVPIETEPRVLACPVCHVVFSEKDFVRHCCRPEDILRYSGY